MKAILIMMDTCNRHMLQVYNSGAKARTPNIDRLAERSLIFDSHFIASAPCMPARRDILTGRVNFLERGWGPIEPYDVTLPRILRKHGIFTHIVTDHSHYMEIGGEGYLQQYNTWDFQRGQETDVWVSSIKDPEEPEPHLGTVFRQYQCNRTRFTDDADRPTPRTFAAAAEWLRQNEGEDNFFLTVEAFDPHEPFDASEEFRAMYPDDFPCFYEWPRYSALNSEETP
ncbi:Sulfatase [Eisenbergiella tayi]|uniref:Sulfatase n=2 Tax=Eisenbergiella tayi TaxID=1432052 RepID=A0A1E3AC95_9FIRM|nr:Sulfatase [Eisenbergiella tayi]